MNPQEKQCSECSTEQPYEAEIMAGGVLCGGCGRTRPNTKYVLASLYNLLSKQLSEKDYWKQRCEAAELYLGSYSEVYSDSDKYKKWQQLKDNHL